MNMEETFNKGYLDGLENKSYYNNYYYKEAYSFGWEIGQKEMLVAQAIKNKNERVEEILKYMEKGNSIFIYEVVKKHYKKENNLCV